MMWPFKTKSDEVLKAVLANTPDKLADNLDGLSFIELTREALKLGEPIVSWMQKGYSYHVEFVPHWRASINFGYGWRAAESNSALFWLRDAEKQFEGQTPEEALLKAIRHAWAYRSHKAAYDALMEVSK